MSDTRQEVFNTVWRHFVVEGWSLAFDREEEVCLYRGPNGTKCAIGLFLSDETALASRCEPVNRLTLPPILKDCRSMEFLKALQAAHDDAAFRGYSISKNLELVAMRFGLEIPTEEK